MFEKIHERLQNFIDALVDSDQSIPAKLEQLEQHLITYQSDYKNLVFYCFEDVKLDEDQYFYITYTYHDLPIDMKKRNELVVSLLYDYTNDFYYEISIFNYPDNGDEYVKTIDLHISH